MKILDDSQDRECVEMEITGKSSQKSAKIETRGPGWSASKFGAQTDSTYQQALGERAWRRLEPEVQERFAARPGAKEVVRYAGTMQTVALSFMGWLFAQTCRLIGNPLVPYRGKDVPMSIELRHDDDLGGVEWRRTYAFPEHGKFTVCSTKCKGLDDEVVEHIGSGFQMRLRLMEEAGALVFKSTAYECTLFGKRIRIPTLLTPGRTTVRHEQLRGDRFRFSLGVVHPILGTTVFQEGIFYSVSDR
jgi:hypothetical protein